MVNEYFQFLDYGGTTYYYLFEFANFSFIGLLALYTYKIRLINLNSLIVWLAIFFTPLIFNYLLFSPYLFGDQFLYSGETFLLKTGNQSQYQMNHIEFAGKILGSIPLPNYMTVTSLAFSNKLLLFLTFLWFKRYFDDENKILLFFLVPSLLLYSSLALREILIIVFSILFLVNLIKDRYLLALIFLYPIFIIKMQMFAFLSLYFVARTIFRAHKSIKHAAFFILSILAATFILESEILSFVNTYRLGFAAENFRVDGGGTSYAAWNLYGQDIAQAIKIDTIQEAIIKSIINLPQIILIPMPWNWSSIFHVFQTMESIFLVYLFYYISMKNKNYKNNEFILLSIILLLSLMLLGLIMANEGTFVRYRFSLFYPFLLAALYIHKNKTVVSKF